MGHLRGLWLALAVAGALISAIGCKAGPGGSDGAGGDLAAVPDAKPLRLVFISCSADAKFFEPVKKGMADAARMLGVQADFRGTAGVDLSAQAEMVRAAVAEGYDGIALNIIDPDAFDEVIQESIDRGVPVVAFNVDDASTPNARLAAVNQRLYEAGRSLAEHVLPEVPADAHVLLTLHDEGISALDDRLRGIREVVEAKGASVTVIVTGNDAAAGADVIASALRAHEDIRIVLGTGQADTEAAGLALERDFPGKGYWSAGFDLSPAILRLLRAGFIRCTVDQQPYVQGFYPVVQLTLYLRYGIRPSGIDAGAAIVDVSSVDRVIELTEEGYR